MHESNTYLPRWLSSPVPGSGSRWLDFGIARWLDFGVGRDPALLLHPSGTAKAYLGIDADTRDRVVVCSGPECYVSEPAGIGDASGLGWCRCVVTSDGPRLDELAKLNGHLSTDPAVSIEAWFAVLDVLGSMLDAPRRGLVLFADQAIERAEELLAPFAARWDCSHYTTFIEQFVAAAAVGPSEKLLLRANRAAAVAVQNRRLASPRDRTLRDELLSGGDLHRSYKASRDYPQGPEAARLRAMVAAKVQALDELSDSWAPYGEHLIVPVSASYFDVDSPMDWTVHFLIDCCYLLGAVVDRSSKPPAAIVPALWAAALGRLGYIEDGSRGRGYVDAGPIPEEIVRALRAGSDVPEVLTVACELACSGIFDGTAFDVAAGTLG